MISFLNGEILKFLSDPKRIVLLVNGIGYEIYIPEYLNNYFVENKVTIGSNLDLEIYYHVTERQPKPLLVGFISYSDKEFFEQLIQVEGIGPVKAANSLVFPINIIINAKSKLILFISTHSSHKYKRHIHLHEDLQNNDIHDYIYYNFYSCFLNNHSVYLFHRFLIHLIIFFLLNFIEELISIFCFPFSCVFNIPITCLYLPIRSFVFNCK